MEVLTIEDRRGVVLVRTIEICCCSLHWDVNVQSGSEAQG